MTLMQVIRAIEGIALSQQSINLVVENDVFRLNGKPDARYGVFAWTQGQHTTSIDSNVMTYQFTFYYVDRLNEDKSNQIEVQSVGIQTLDNIIRELDAEGLYVSNNCSMRTFNQRFLDECAGVFCNVSIDVPVGSLCPENVMVTDGGFTFAFNDSFRIF